MNDAEKLILEQKLRKAAPLINRLSQSSGGLPDRVKAALNKVLDEKFPVIRVLSEAQMRDLLLRLIGEQPASGIDLVNDVMRANFSIGGQGEGEVYALLASMEASGLIIGEWREGGARMMKRYSLTSNGRKKWKSRESAAPEVEAWLRSIVRTA